MNRLTHKGEAVDAFDTVIEPIKDVYNTDRLRHEFIETVVDSSSVVLALESDDEYVGTASVTVTDAATVETYLKGRCGYTLPDFYTESPSLKVGFFSNLYVAESFQANGNGERLFKALLHECEHLCDVLLSELWIHPGRDAVHLYDKYGFERIHDCPIHWESAVDGSVECSICGYDCECTGQIWHRKLPS